MKDFQMFSWIVILINCLIIACTDKNQGLKIQPNIANEFEMVDKGEIQHFLGMK